MRQRTLIVAAVAISAFLIAILITGLLRPKEPGLSNNNPPTEVELSGKRDSTIVPKKPLEPNRISTNKEQYLRDYIEEMSQQDKRAKPPDFPIELWARIVAMHYQDMRKNGPIEFYGMVVDPSGQPLSDVRIDVRVSSYQESIEKLTEANRDKKIETIEVRTDKNGMFTISNRTGFGIVVSTFQKDGY